MKNLALVGLVLSLAACPGPGEGGSSIIGTWDEIPGPTTEGDEPGSAVFRDDGTFEIDDEGEIEVGTFEEVDGTLILTNDVGDVQELPYATDGSRFTPLGLRRVGGGGDGFVGQWLAVGTRNGEESGMELLLGDDNRFTLDVAEESQLSGSWREQAGELITTLEFVDGDGETLTLDLPWYSISGTVSILGYERR